MRHRSSASSGHLFSGIRRLVAAGVTALLCLTASLVVSVSAASASTKAVVDLSGVTLTFGDQFKQYQTILTAANALKGAKYTVNWQEFVGGPPIVAAETGGSVDLGDMAETPTVFAQTAGDPVKVVAATVSANPKVSPYGIVVPSSSKIKKVSQLRGQTVAVQEGTVGQYILIQILKKAGVPYNAVTIENLSTVNASAAVSSGKVAAAVISQPLIAVDQAAGQVHLLTSAAGYTQTLGYLTASEAALDNPKKAAAVADFIERFYKAETYIKQNPQAAIDTYVKIYGVTEAEAKQAAGSVQEEATQITPAIISYQQTEANTFLSLGLISQKINVKGIFDLPFNKAVNAKAGIQ
jgi:sulfonate transport system substrate-binding protein